MRAFDHDLAAPAPATAKAPSPAYGNVSVGDSGNASAPPSGSALGLDRRTSATATAGSGFDYDVVIVGAGLAGLQCARLLGGKGLRVLLADAKRDVGAEVRTTGIFVRRTLEDFPLPEDCLGPPVAQVRLWSPRGRHLDLEAAQHEFRVGDMARLYRTLHAEALARGVDWWPGARFRAAEPEAKGVRLRFEGGARESTVRARFVIGADGPLSRVARDLGLSRNKTFLAGVEEVLPGSGTPLTARQPVFHCFLDAELAPGYLGWLVDDGRELHLGVGGDAARFSPAVALARFRQRVEQRLGLSLPAQAQERRGGRIPVGGVLPHIACARGLLVGDAAGAVSPLTAGGLDACLRLSELAARLTVQHLEAGAPARGPLRAYDGALFRGRFASRRLMRFAVSGLRSTAALELSFACLAGPLRPLAAHVFFGRGSFPLPATPVPARLPVG